MLRAQAAQDSRRLVASRITGGLALSGLSILAFWAATAPVPRQVDLVFPWAVERLPPLLRATAAWFLFLGIVVIVSAAGPLLCLTHDKWRNAMSPAGDAHSQDTLSRQNAPRRCSLSLPRVRLAEGSAALILAGLIAAFTLAYGWMAVTRHLRFNSTGYDLAIGTQAIWNTARGHPLATSLEVDNYLADHFAPSLLLLVPIYAVCPSPSVLVSIQALALGLGAVPLYRLAKRRLASVTVAMIAATVYLLYPATGYLLRFDFHSEFLVVPAFLAAFDAMDQERWKLASVWLLLALGCKEDMGLTVAAFGLYALIVRRKAAWGIAWLLIGIATSAFAFFWLIPMLRGESSDTLARYRWLGNSPGEVLNTLLAHPGMVWDHVAHPRQLLYFLQLLLPVGYLALLAPPALLLAGPALVLNLLSESWPQASIYFQYTAAIIPGVFIAAVLGTAHLRRMVRCEWAWRVATLALLPLSLATFLLSNPFRELVPLPNVWAKLNNADAVRLGLQMVPPDVSVVTTNNYAPHLAHRLELYIIGLPSQRTAPPDPDAVFFNLTDYRFTSRDQYREYLLRLDPERYGVTFSAQGVVVIERDKGSHKEFEDLVSELSI